MIGTQLHISFAQIVKEREIPVKNDEMTSRYKPDGGFWTSTWRAETQDSEWVEWCRGENYGNPDTCNWFLLTPKEDVRLYVIDSYADLERLLNTYKYESPLIKGLENSHLSHYYRGIDFERLSQDYDGLHLTSEGNNRLHYWSSSLNMNAWDSESTVWFRWCFAEVQRIETPQPMQEEASA